MRGRNWLVLLFVTGALLGASAAGLAQPAAQGGLGEAAVDVTVEPSARSVGEAGSLGLDVHVEGALSCSPGMPPSPLVGTLLPGDGDGSLDLAFQPEEIRLDWEPVGETGDVEYRVNETASVLVGVVSAPVEPVLTRFLVIFSADGDGDGPDCTAQGYHVTQNEQSGDPVTVEPAQQATQGEDPSGAGFNWVPLVLAVALLGLVSVFAYQRDQRRG